MDKLSISHIESLTGIKAHTLRIWEQRYNLSRCKRTGTNIRYYDSEDLRFFLNVATLSHNGFKISEISKMPEKDIDALVHQINTGAAQPDFKIKQLLNATVAMDAHAFDESLDTFTLEMGMQQTMEKVVFPFLHQIGNLWQSKTINVAHEHFASHKIAQKISVETRSLKSTERMDARKYLLFLPPQEQHELSLLYAEYLLKKTGHKVLYLGADLPYAILQEASDFFKPDYALTVLTSAYSYATVEDILKSLCNILNAPLLVSGYAVLQDIKFSHHHLHVLPGIEAFKKMIH